MAEILTRNKDFLSNNVVFYNNLIIHQHPTLLFNETNTQITKRIITYVKAYTHISKRIKVMFDRSMEQNLKEKLRDEIRGTEESKKEEKYPIFESHKQKYFQKIASELRSYGEEIGKTIFVVTKEFDVKRQMEKQGVRPDIVIFLSKNDVGFSTEKKAEIVLPVIEKCKRHRSVPEFTGAKERLRDLFGTTRQDIAALFQNHEFSHHETETSYSYYRSCKDEDHEFLKLIDDSPGEVTVEPHDDYMVHKADEILGDCLKILDNFGTYGLIRWFPDLQLRLTLLATSYNNSQLVNKTETNMMVNTIYEMALTTFFSCKAIISELDEIEEKECLLSDRLWMFLWNLRERFNPPKENLEIDRASDHDDSEKEPDSDYERRKRECELDEFHDNADDDLPTWLSQFDVQKIKKPIESKSAYNPYEKPVEELVGEGFGKYIVSFNSEVLCYSFQMALKLMTEREFPLFACIIPFFHDSKMFQLGTPFKSSMRNPRLVDEINEMVFAKRDKDYAKTMKESLEFFMDSKNRSGLLITTSSVPNYVIEGIVTQGKCPISLGYRFEEPSADFFDLPVRDGMIQLVVDLSTHDKFNEVRKEVERFSSGGCKEPEIKSKSDIFTDPLESSETRIEKADEGIMDGFPEDKTAKEILRDVVSKVCIPDIFANLQVNTAKDGNGGWMATAGFPFDFPVSKKVMISDSFQNEEDAVENVCKIALTRFKKENPNDFFLLKNPRTEVEEKREKYHTRGPREFEPDLPEHPFHESENFKSKYSIKNDKQYRRIFPECLQGGQIEPGKPCYLYLVSISKTRRYCDNFNIKNSSEASFPHDFSDQAFGILVAKPIVSVAPFSVYHPKKQKTTYALDVEVTLLRSMLVFDEVELSQLKHFYRNITELHNGLGEDCLQASDVLMTLEKKRDLQKEMSKESKKFTSGWGNAEKRVPEYWELKQWVRQGEVQLLYVPLAKRQLPWHGFDIDWFTITEMEIFESRCMHIIRARRENHAKKDAEMNRLINQRRQLTPQKDENGEPTAEWESYTTKIIRLRENLNLLNDANLESSKTGPAPHPLIPKRSGKTIRKRHEEKIQEKHWDKQRVWYEPYMKADAGLGFGIIQSTKQEQFIVGRELHWRQEVEEATFYYGNKIIKAPQLIQESEYAWRRPVKELFKDYSKHMDPRIPRVPEPTKKRRFYGELYKTFDRQDHNVRILNRKSISDNTPDSLIWQPTCDKFYLTVEFSNKDGTMKDTSLREPIPYGDYHKRIKPEFNGKGKLVKISDPFNNSRQTMITRHAPEGGKKQTKFLFMEHIEYHFLPKNLFIQAAKLPGITVRLIQLLNAEELRVKFAKEYNGRVFPTLDEGNNHSKPGLSPLQVYKMLTKSPLTTYKTTSIKRFKGLVEGTEARHDTFLFTNLPPTAAPSGYVARDDEFTGDSKEGTEYSYKKIKISEKKLPAPTDQEQFLKLFDSLGPVYPPPVFGEKAFYLPPHVDKIVDHKVLSIPQKQEKLDFGLLSNTINCQEKQAWYLKRVNPKKTPPRYTEISCWSKPSSEEFSDKDHFDREIEWYGEKELELFGKQQVEHPGTFIPWYKDGKTPGIVDESLKLFKSFGKFNENKKEGEAREEAYESLVQQAINRLVIQSQCKDWFSLIQKDAAIFKAECETETDSEDTNTVLSLKNESEDQLKIHKCFERIERKATDPPIDFITRECFAPPPSLLLRALTQRTANDFFNLERLEFFGDSFIKIACTRVLYEKYSYFTDGELTSARGAYISNANFLKLFKLKLSDGSCLQIPRYMNCHDLSQKGRGILRAPGWVYTLNHALTDDNQDETEIFPRISDEFTSETVRPSHFNYMTIDSINKLVDKKTADVIESLIGAYLVTGGEKMAARFVWMLNQLYMDTLISNPEYLEGIRRKRTVQGDCLITHPPEFWPENAYEARAAFGEDHMTYKSELVEPDSKTDKIIKDLQNELQYEFISPHLCRLALAKKKFTKDPKDNYERLEFLGDAILDYLVVDELFNRRSASLDSGELTDLKQAITSNNLFGSLAFCMGLPQSTLMKASAAKDHISAMHKLEEFKNLLNKQERGVPLNPDLQRVLNVIEWTDKTVNRAKEYSCPYLLDIPKWFGDVFESMFGAVWLDCNQCLPQIWDIYKSKIIPIMGIEGNKPYNPEFINKLNPRREIAKRLYSETAGTGKTEKLNSRDKIREFLKSHRMEEHTEDCLRFTGYYFCYVEIYLSSQKNVTKRDIGIGLTENSAIFAVFHRLLFQLNL